MPETLEKYVRESSPKVPANFGRTGRKASLGDRFGKRFFRTLFGIGLVPILAVVGLYFFAQSMSYRVNR